MFFRNHRQANLQDKDAQGRWIALCFPCPSFNVPVTLSEKPCLINPFVWNFPGETRKRRDDRASKQIPQSMAGFVH
jgi:hypothetical protein